MDAVTELPSLDVVLGVRLWRKMIITGRLAAFKGILVNADGREHRFQVETADDIIEIPVARGSPPKVAIRCQDGIQEIDPARKVIVKVGKDKKGREVILLPILVRKG